MNLRLTRTEAGFTYIAALVMVVVMGIMLGVTGQSMRTIMKREREKELIFRGLQYRDAIERWTKKGAMPLLELDWLLKDPKDPGGKVKYLRQRYKDPVTGGEWKILKDPNTKEIQGVASTSDEEPFKQGNFPDVIKSFEEKKKYSEWEFVFRRRVTTTAAPAAPGAPPALPQPSFPLSAPESP